MINQFRDRRALLYRWRKEYFKREDNGEVFPGIGKSKGILAHKREELKSEGFIVSRKRVAKSMKEEGLQSKIRKQWKVPPNEIYYQKQWHAK